MNLSDTKLTDMECTLVNTTFVDMKYPLCPEAMSTQTIDSDSNSNVDVQSFRNPRVPAFISQNGK